MSKELTPLDYFNRCFDDFPAEIIKSRQQKREKLTYVEWYNYMSRAYKEFQPKGFTTEIRGVHAAGGFLYLIVRVTNLNNGVYHDGIGLAPVEKDKLRGFGGAGPEAYSQGLRRAFAGHGMGLPFYMNEDEQLYAQEGDETEQGDEADEAGDAEGRTTARRPRKSDDSEGEVSGEGDDEAGHRRSGSGSRGRGDSQRAAKDRGRTRSTEEDDDAGTDSKEDGDGDEPTKTQMARLNSLAKIFEEGGFEGQLKRFRKKFERNDTKQGASIVIREMKEFLESKDVDWRDEAVEEDDDEGKE